MKHFIIFFIVAMMVQNISAQNVKTTEVEVVYVDENGNRLDRWQVAEQGYKYEREKSNVKFVEAAPLQNKSKQVIVKPIRGSSISTSSGLEVGKNYFLFEVVKCEDESLKGKRVACQVLVSRKSNLSGAEGRLVLRPLYIEKDLEQIPLVPNDIYRRGLNRTNVKYLVIPTIVGIIIAGSRAEIQPHEEIALTLADMSR